MASLKFNPGEVVAMGEAAKQAANCVKCGGRIGQSERWEQGGLKLDRVTPHWVRGCECKAEGR